MGTQRQAPRFCFLVVEGVATPTQTQTLSPTLQWGPGRLLSIDLLFSCQSLEVPNYYYSTVAHCGVLFVFVNYCPNID